MITYFLLCFHAIILYRKHTKRIYSKEESKHITKVLRKNVGDKINFTDGKGNLLISEIIISDRKNTQVKVIEKISKKKQHNYHLHKVYLRPKIWIVLNGF